MICFKLDVLEALTHSPLLNWKAEESGEAYQEVVWKEDTLFVFLSPVDVFQGGVSNALLKRGSLQQHLT